MSDYTVSKSIESNNDKKFIAKKSKLSLPSIRS